MSSRMARDTTLTRRREKTIAALRRLREERRERGVESRGSERDMRCG